MQQHRDLAEISYEQGLHTSLHSIGSNTKELKEEWSLDQHWHTKKSLE